jgi:S1-C subfamily serine protease
VNTIVTTDKALPVLDSYTVVLPNRQLVGASSGPRDCHCNLAVLRLDTPWSAGNPEVAAASLGGVVVVVGADVDATPTVRLAVIHRFSRSVDGPIPVLDLPGDSVTQGSLVLDPEGRLIGLAALGPSGIAIAIPSAMIGRMLTPSQDGFTPVAAASLMPLSSSRRGWLGVALQPITVPEQLVGRAGQASGRMVVSVTKDGPAEMAGVRVGDVLLALNGISACGPQALRAFLGGDRVGTTVEVKLLRDGNVLTTRLIIAVQPG